MTHPAYGTLRQVTANAAVLLADNPNMMTLDGTNTWLLRAPGQPECVVVDPGPADEEHLARVAAHGPVAAVLITHHHGDHTDGAARLAELTGAPTHAIEPAHRYNGGGDLHDGQVIEAAGLRLRIWVTPGHTADSLCVQIEGDGSLLTGDTILGRGTTIVAHPDGRLGPYLTTLRRLLELPPGTTVLPGHGPELPDVAAVATAYLTHREQRLEQVRQALATLGQDATARAVVELVYADVDQSLWPAAEWSVQAQLAYLRS
ncbi:MBL fold metallo-hydrolase [Crossiella sp. CA198]|uniref:MBL fold metallo-hydrolase n=1 Tax=Crossiella sp. CA198 TaxID=3455607 RepID=UPI003F8D44FD